MTAVKVSQRVLAAGGGHHPALVNRWRSSADTSHCSRWAGNRPEQAEMVEVVLLLMV
jgi:hypothetical protein